MDLVRKSVRLLMDVVYPRRCFFSGKGLKGAAGRLRYMDEKVLKEVEFINGPACLSCGVPFRGEVEGDRLCPHCVDLKPVYDKGKALFLMRGPGRALVHELKYRDGYYLWKDVGGLASLVPDYVEFISNSILVPVPLHKSKMRSRGYNQAEYLAKELAKIGRNVRVEGILSRVRQTLTQTRLSKEERRRNVKNAFALLPGSAINRDSKYIIVDDVFTTGSTLNECAKVLKGHGVNKLSIVTLGHG